MILVKFNFSVEIIKSQLFQDFEKHVWAFPILCSTTPKLEIRFSPKEGRMMQNKYILIWNKFSIK